MFHRMDGGRVTIIDVVISKAFTTVAARRFTWAHEQVSEPVGPAFGSHLGNPGRFAIAAGGVPRFVNDNEIVSGIGCSSGPSDQEEVAAQSGVDARPGGLCN